MRDLFIPLRRALTTITWVVCTMLALQSVATATVSAHACCGEQCLQSQCEMVGCQICVVPTALPGERLPTVMSTSPSLEGISSTGGTPAPSPEIWTPPD